MGIAWAESGPHGNDFNEARNIAGPSTPAMGLPRRRTKARKPFISADYKPVTYDGIFRVVIITSGSVASVKLPLIVGELSKNGGVDVQVIGTDNSRHFYTQEQVDEQISLASGLGPGGMGNKNEEDGVRIWHDSDEWSDWTKLGDPILHIELRRWADMVVVAPCSANFLAKLAAGMCDNLPLSLLRALPPSTPVILCPAMNTHMYSHPFTAEHLQCLQQKLGYLVSGPQGAGMLACGDEGPGKMTDWSDIVDMVETFAKVFHLRRSSGDAKGTISYPPVSRVINPFTHRRVAAAATPSASTKSRNANDGEEDRPVPGYTGELDASNDAQKDSSQVGPESSIDLQWRDIWPE